MIHSASDLMWTDGLHEMRQLFASTAEEKAVEGKLLGTSFTLTSLQDLAWYCEWKGLSVQHAVLLPVPVVQVSELLDVLGVPKAQHRSAMQQLRKADLPALQQMVVPEYLAEVVAIIDQQIPGIGLAKQHSHNELFAR